MVLDSLQSVELLKSGKTMWCYRFVNLMGGEIWVESEGLGKGTTVTFIVKLGLPEKPSEQDRQSTPSPASVHSRTDFSNVKVLVTDDNGYVFCTMFSAFHFFRPHEWHLTCVPFVIGFAKWC